MRHGRTAFNIDERYLGALDPPLDELGLQQAADLASLLAGRADAIVCSPRLRAMQTAKVLASAWHVPFTILDAFAERNVGVYEGLTRNEKWRSGALPIDARFHARLRLSVFLSTFTWRRARARAG